MAERQIGRRRSSLVLSARFPVVKWRPCSVAKSAYSENFSKSLHPKRIFFDRKGEYIVTGLISPILKIYGKLKKEHFKCLRLKMKHDK